MKTLVISFGTDGNAKCIHTEALPLSEIGTLQVNRASTVEFNDATQKWEVKWPGQTDVAFTHESRLQCLAWEVEELTKRLAGNGDACPLPSKS